MIAQIEIASETLPSEIIKLMSCNGIDIKECTVNDYDSWNYSGDDHASLSSEQKRERLHEAAIIKNEHKFKVGKSPIVVDVEDFIQKYPNIKFTFIKTFAIKAANVDGAAGALMSAIDRMNTKIAEIDTTVDFFNHKCQVHIGGSHLLLINRVMLCEDCCTDHLQEMISKGWRIVSVNHQEARRPDYVLGRYDPAYDMEN